MRFALFDVTFYGLHIFLLLFCCCCCFALIVRVGVCGVCVCVFCLVLFCLYSFCFWYCLFVCFCYLKSSHLLKKNITSRFTISSPLIKIIWSRFTDAKKKKLGQDSPSQTSRSTPFSKKKSQHRPPFSSY